MRKNFAACVAITMALPNASLAAWPSQTMLVNALHASAPVVPVSFTCGYPIRPLVDMSNMGTFYTGDTNSTIDPAKWTDYINRVWMTSATMSRFIGQIETAVANSDLRASIGPCLLRQVRVWADAGALLGNIEQNNLIGHRQAVLIGIWTGIGFANAYALAGAMIPVPAEDRAAIVTWFGNLMETIVAEFTPPPESRTQADAWLDLNGNHRYWAAAATGMLAINIGDAAKRDWSLNVLRAALADAPPDGALPLELARGTKGLHYQSFALEALGYIVRLADTNGSPLTAAEEGKLAAIAKFAADAFEDPSIITARTGYVQEKRPDMANWMDLLIPHFERVNPAFAARLDSIAAPYRPLRSTVAGFPMTALMH